MRTAILSLGAALISVVLVVAGVASAGAPASRAAHLLTAGSAPAMDMSMPGMASMPMAASGAASGAVSSSIAAVRINMVIVPDSLHGSDKRNHDSFIPSSITAVVGQKVIITVYNLDQAPHSVTAPGLGLNVIVPPAAGDGAQKIMTFSFTARKAGVYHWKCILPCDNGGVNAWAMTHDGYMAGTITITKA